VVAVRRSQNMAERGSMNRSSMGQFEDKEYSVSLYLAYVIIADQIYGQRNFHNYGRTKTPSVHLLYPSRRPQHGPKSNKINQKRQKPVRVLLRYPVASSHLLAALIA
jgi:hypothetical protein